MRPRETEIAKVTRNFDGSMDIEFAEDSQARYAVFVMQDGGKIKVKDPRGSYQASKRVVEVSIRG
jgi:hypothetical protein